MAEPTEIGSTVDEAYMREALREAEGALRSKDRPVGSLIVIEGRVVGRAHHQVRLLRDPTAHASIIAITQAASQAQSDQLAGATFYMTQEPCAMCVGAILLCGAARLVYGAPDSKRGACGSVVDLTSNEQLNRHLIVVRDVLSGECAALLRRAVGSQV